MRIFLYNAGFPLWFYRLRQPSGLSWAKKYNNFHFQVQSFVQDRFNEDDIYLGANRGTHLLKEVGSGKLRIQRKKRRTETFFAPFIGVRKMATDRAKVTDIRQPRKQPRPRKHIEQMSFPRSALQTSPPDDRITTKICTTCTYYREILSLRTLRSGRTIEYCVLMNLRTIEKRKDWTWIGFQSGPPFFVRTIENYVLLSVRNIEKWLYDQRWLK